MPRLLPTPLIALALAAGAIIPSAHAQADRCWFGALSNAQKRALVHDYARVKQTRGKPAADAWAQAERAAYIRKFAEKGICPADKPRAAAPQPQPDGKVLNRYGQPCKRLELENQNVPNIGGSMGWALIQVCKD